MLAGPDPRAVRFAEIARGIEAEAKERLVAFEVAAIFEAAVEEVEQVTGDDADAGADEARSVDGPRVEGATER